MLQSLCTVTLPPRPVLLRSPGTDSLSRAKGGHMASRALLLAVAVRVGIALATRTFFQPDEYFQSLEVAHHAVFGYGQLTWEWLSPRPIRSIIYPALNIPVYWLVRVLNLDHTVALFCAFIVYSRRSVG